MNLRSLFLLIVLSACATEEVKYSNLQEYLTMSTVSDLEDVIACAASKKEDSDTVFVFYYPVPDATNVKYFETVDASVVKSDFSKYHEISLPKEKVFNGYLERFVKESAEETWCIVTYEFAGELRTSQPILLKNKTKPSEWVEEVEIDLNEKTNPKFSWEDGIYKENTIYFQVIANEKNDLLSGTYTKDKWFQYYKLENVVLNVTRNAPPQLMLNNSYNFTMMGVSIDNWVNLVVQKDFQIK